MRENAPAARMVPGWLAVLALALSGFAAWIAFPFLVLFALSFVLLWLTDWTRKRKLAAAALALGWTAIWVAASR